MFLNATPRNQTLNTCQLTQVFSILQAYCIMAEDLTPMKASRAATVTSQVPLTQDTVPEVCPEFYKKALQVEVDGTTLGIDRQKKYGQIRKYRRNQVDEIRRSLMVNPPDDPVTMTAWQLSGAQPGRAWFHEHFPVISR